MIFSKFQFSRILFFLMIICVLFSCKSLNKPEKESDELETKEVSKRMVYWEKAMEQEFRMLRNPQTGKIPEGIYEAELIQAKEVLQKQIQEGRVSANTYTFQGPENLGGRVRSVVYDKRYNGTSNKIILAGGVSGGLFKSTDDGATWTRKSPLTTHYSCTSIAQDTRAGFEDTWYYATGEATGNSTSATGAFYGGHGVFKSTDNGETWSRLTASNTSAVESFSTAADFIMKVAVDPTNGNVYAAAACTILRSTDGGTTWSTSLSGTLASASQITDIVITSTGRFYASFSGNSPTTVDGVWTSTTGASGFWTKIAGTSSGTTPLGWDAKDSYGRVVLGVAPSSENILYVLYAKSTASSCAGTPAPEAKLFKWNQTTTTWTDLSAFLPDEVGCLDGNDPFAVQGGYDLVVAVKPDDPSTVIIGGTNAYRSTDGFTTTVNVKRIGGYASPASYSLYASSHPDIHAFAFQPTSASVMICGNDGGLQRTTDITASTVSWSNISSGFRTYQYYYVAIDPRSGNAKVMGGAQDNGSTRNTGGSGTSFESVWGGDGVAVGLSDDISGTTYEFVGSQQGSISRRASTLSANFGTSIRPTAATSSDPFVTVFHLDQDNSTNLYYANENKLFKTSSSSTVSTGTWTEFTGVATAVGGGTDISAIATSRGTYSGSTSSLFIGTASAKVFRIDDPVAAGGAAIPADISGASFPGSSYVSSVSVNPRNDDTVLVTFSNYGVSSVFWTGNANTASPTWRLVEGNLPLPSYRSSAIVFNAGLVEYYVGTSVGLYRAVIDGTSDVSAASTTWVQEGSTNIGNAVISHLAYRVSDNNLLVGTHGNGMWRSTITALPVNFTSFSGSSEKNQNKLYWTVQNEINNKGYFIERMQKGENSFSNIGFVAAYGDGNSSSSNTYQFVDNKIDLASDLCQYRLKQTDKDGQYKYSSIVLLSRKPSIKLVEYISNDKNNLLIRMNNITGESLQIRIFDVSGRIFIRENSAATTQTINISSLSSGVYYVDIIQKNKKVFVQKFIK